MHRLSSVLLACLALLGSVIGASILSSSPAAAQIQNGSFEDPPLPDSSATDNVIPGWSGALVFSNAFGVMNPSAGAFTDPIPDGQQVAYLEGRAIAQSTGVIIQPNTTYTLTAWHGRHTGFDGGGIGFIQLWAGGTISDGNVSGGTLAAQNVFGFNFVSPGLFAPVSASFTAPAISPLNGLVLSARFEKVEERILFVDQVVLQQSGGNAAAAAPEPATLALLATGLLPVTGAVIRRRWPDKSCLCRKA